MVKSPFPHALAAAALALFLAAPLALAGDVAEDASAENQEMSIGEATDNMTEDAKSVGDKAKEMASDIADKASELAEDAVEGAKELYEKAKAKVEEATAD